MSWHLHPQPIYATGCTLRAAIEEANAHAPVPSTISFVAFNPSDFFFKEVRTISLPGGALQIKTPVTISGASSGRPAHQFIIAGSGNDRIFEIKGPPVTIEGMTLAGGNATAAQQDGGAIYSTGGPLTLEKVWIRDSVAPRYGGAVYLDHGSGNKISYSTFSGNTAGFGGAIATREAGLAMVNSTISDNTANGQGSPTNALGGGLYAHSVSDFNHVSLQHVTIANNSAGQGRGGGVAIENGPSHFNFSNTIIAANTAATDREYLFFNGIAVSDGYNLVGDNPGDAPPFPGSGNWTSTDLLDLPANFGPLGLPFGASVPMRGLEAGSAAIDKGKSFGVPIDQRGGLRPIDNPTIPNATGGDGSDIGAFEVGGMVVNSLGDEADATPGDGICETASGNRVCTLRAAVQEISASPSGGNIYFALPGSAPYTINLNTALPNFEKNTNMVGPGANQLTISRSTTAANAFRIFDFEAVNGGNDGQQHSSATVFGVTIANGLDHEPEWRWWWWRRICRPQPHCNPR